MLQTLSTHGRPGYSGRSKRPSNLKTIAKPSKTAMEGAGYKHSLKHGLRGTRAGAVEDNAGSVSEALPLLIEKPRVEPPKQKIDWVATGACFLFPAIGGLLFGYDIGATSGVSLSVTGAETSGTTWYDLNSFQAGLLVSLSLLGALMGSIVTLIAGNKLGRRTELILASALYGGSACLMSSAGSLGQLLLGRTLYGVGIGFAMHAAPAYIAETTPSSVRGLLISLKEAVIVGGILLGYLVGYLFIEQEAGWRNMTLTAVPLAITLAVGMVSHLDTYTCTSTADADEHA